MTRRLGRLAPHPHDTHPRLALGPYLRRRAALPPAPAVIDWTTKVADWPMYGNSDWGDCVWAMIGHAIEAYTTYGQGATVKVTDDDVLAGYSAVTGFNPNAGPPGANSTDQGTVIQDALNYWRTTGVGGHRILAFAEVDIHNPSEVAAALAVFGHLMVGVNFPKSAMTQFDAGQPWDVITHDGGIEGGHAVSLGYDAAGRMKAVTWARVQPLTAAWWGRYVEEAWVVASPEWLTAVGANPEGLDTAALNAAFLELTGQPGPFPAVPVPQPPAPVPGPAPVADQADRDLAAAVDAWAHLRHRAGTAKVANAFLNWKAVKGL